MMKTRTERPVVVSPGLPKKWLVLQLLKFERKVYSNRYDRDKFSAGWAMTLRQRIDRSDASDTAGVLTDADKTAVERTLERYFNANGFRLNEVHFLALGVASDGTMLHRTWDVRVDVS
jgi:hypothetical protein